MNIVLVGCGGTGLSAIAYILKKLGYDNVVGIDSKESQITNNMQSFGIKVIIGHDKYKLHEKDFVIYSDAVINSPVVQKSFEFMNKRLKHYHRPYSYFEFVGEISKYFKTLAIAGTHGKSTTTAIGITSYAKVATDLAVGIVGALVPQLGDTNYFLNNKKIPQVKKIFDHILTGNYTNFDHKLIKKYSFIIEADEFNKHFLHIDTDYALITNMQLDHSDVYANFKEYSDTFKLFVSKVKEKVFVLDSDKQLIKFKKIFPKKIKICKLKKFSFKYIFGDHNQKNATLIYNLFISSNSKIDKAKLIANIHSFRGLWRRMELLKIQKNGSIIYSDYGHHPDELLAVFNALKAHYKDKELITIFQPHQARRVLQFWDEFLKVIKKFDKNYIYSIYAARENVPQLLETFKSDLFKGVKDIGNLGNLMSSKSGGKYITEFNEIKDVLSSLSSNQIAVVFTAGSLDFELRKNYSLV